MELETYIEEYYNRKIEGMDFSEIRIELKRKGLEDAEIKNVIKAIDHRLLNNVKEKHEKSTSGTTKIIGFLLVIGGTIITVGTYSGWIRLGNYFIFAYGPILGGLAMIASSRNGHSNIFIKNQKFKR